MILDNRLAPGSSHLETELASLLGMSRTPVREAALVLQARGLVEVKPRHGIRILPLAPEDMAEIYDILTELECLAVEKAAQANLSSDKFAAADRAIAEMDHALEADDLGAWARADAAFHAELVRLGGNSRIAAIVRTYSDQVHRARKFTLTLRPRPVQSNDDHRRVLEAMKSGDWKTARKAHREHRITAKHTLVDIIEQHGLKSL